VPGGRETGVSGTGGVAESRNKSLKHPITIGQAEKIARYKAIFIILLEIKTEASVQAAPGADPARW
jgi:hypothetical protein